MRGRKVLELLHHINITGDAHKLSASVAGDDSEGFYMGFPLSSGDIVLTWEPGNIQKTMDDLSKQNALFKKFSEMLPEMIYEVDLTGKILFANKYGLEFFGLYERGSSKRFEYFKSFP